MNENSPSGSPRGIAPRPAAPARGAVDRAVAVDVDDDVDDAPLVAPRPAVGGAPRFEKLPRPGFPPSRPPDRLSHPSTRSLKKSVRSNRFDVNPPCECPTSQNALMFSLPIWS